MPIQAPQWTDYLNCPVCCREFGPPPRSPISLGCGHTLCRHCLKHLHRKQCPFDQTAIQTEPEELVVNTALLQLAGYAPPAQPFHPPCIKALPEHDRQAYDVIVRCLEHLAIYLKLCGNASNSLPSSRLSRPMQRKLVTLLQCAMTDDEGRGRAARAARSLGERTVTELILQHQNPQQLSANLWAAVRARGCQFLGPAMQEEVLKLVLLALEDGSALSRKVLVMFVVQRLEPHFPQASKTSIGHVVQLLYRASCFKVSKRECDSSLMQLKEEFRTYDSLRREHDAQIVQIATEAGLRIAPDQWSALLYGDTVHKSHMQSIIDKLQTPQSFAQSVQELFIALQRTGDPAQLIVISMHLDRLASIDASPDAKSPNWQQLAEVIISIKEVVSGLIHYLQHQGRDTNHNQKHILQDRCLEPSTSHNLPTTGSTPTHLKYNMAMCRDSATRSFCPRGSSCSLLHFDEDYDRSRGVAGAPVTNGNYAYVQQMVPMPQVQMAQHVYRYPMPPMRPMHVDGYNIQQIAPLPGPVMPQEIIQNPEYTENNRHDGNLTTYGPPPAVAAVPNGPLVAEPFYRGVLRPGPGARVEFRPGYPCPAVQYPRPECPGPLSPRPLRASRASHGDCGRGPYQGFEERSSEVVPEFEGAYSYGRDTRKPNLDSTWSPNSNTFNFNEIRNALHTATGEDAFNLNEMRNAIHAAPTEDVYAGTGERRAIGADRLPAMKRSTTELADRADDMELEEELLALERRIYTEFKSD